MSHQTETDIREAFYTGVYTGEWTLAETVRQMRKVARMTQVEYARFVGIAPRIVIDLERGVGNPTLKSLEKLAQPFGLTVNFSHKDRT